MKDSVISQFDLGNMGMNTWLPSSSSLEAVIYLIGSLAIGVGISTVAIIYSEILFLGTRYLYKTGKLQRYYPLPTSRGAFDTWINTMSFTIPTALFVRYAQVGLVRSLNFDPLAVSVHVLAYMVMHDFYFYWSHWAMHTYKPLYNMLHAVHHEYTYAMHCYVVGFAELAENFIQVGLPWVTWTAIAGANWWNWTVPLSFIVFTTLVGHSGYRSDYIIAMFHPLALPIVVLSNGWLLTIGDHQMHHTYRRVNYGLFWRFWDVQNGTYKKPHIKAHDVNYWSEWARKKGEAEHDEQARKWLGKHQEDFHEVQWGI